MSMTELQNRIDYHFQDPSILQTALTHSSYANEHALLHSACYERLEFLGDAILGLTAAELLYQRKPLLPEGKMTRIRAELVCEESLCRTAQLLQLGSCMRLGHGAELSGDRARPSILADMVEALIAAIFLDGGLEKAKSFIHRFVLADAESVISCRSLDSKTALQELVQKQGAVSIRYELTGESGPDHDKRFTVAVFINGAYGGDGEGRSKKEAEQAAAAAALRKYAAAGPGGGEAENGAGTDSSKQSADGVKIPESALPPDL